MTPDWKDAPEWARFRAQDGGGDWYWYECEPIKDERLRLWKPFDGLVARVKFGASWNESLQERPKP